MRGKTALLPVLLLAIAPIIRGDDHGVDTDNNSTEPSIVVHSSHGSGGVNILEREVRRIGPARREGSRPQFRYSRLGIIDPATGRKARTIVPGVTYEAQGTVAFPYAGTFPYINQFEEGRAENFSWTTGDLSIPSDGLFLVITTFTVDPALAGKRMSFGDGIGANRSRSAKFRVASN